MHRWLKISPHHHSGRLRPHEHTSYLPLALLVLTVGLVLGACSVSTVKGDSPGPQAGSVALSGTVPKSAPKTGAVITAPADGQHFGTSPVTVSGTCPANTLVEIYKNDIFAGSVPCSSKGTFSLDVDLLIGKNVLVAKVYDVLNQAGPDSKKITVYYDALPPQFGDVTPLNLSGAQLLLNTDAVYRGLFPDQLLNVPISIIGGTPPYAVNVEWGDSSNKVISRNNNLTFNASHTYHKPGTYQITIQATDSQQRVAFLAVAAIVNGKPETAAASTNSGSSGLANKLLVLWPAYAIVGTTVISFWVGERREKQLLKTAAPVYHA